MSGGNFLKNMKITDFDIATVEALRDLLLENGFERSNPAIVNAEDFIQRLYAMFDFAEKEHEKLMEYRETLVKYYKEYKEIYGNATYDTVNKYNPLDHREDGVSVIY